MEIYPCRWKVCNTQMDLGKASGHEVTAAASTRDIVGAALGPRVLGNSFLPIGQRRCMSDR